MFRRDEIPVKTVSYYDEASSTCSKIKIHLRIVRCCRLIFINRRLYYVNCRGGFPFRCWTVVITGDARVKRHKPPSIDRTLPGQTGSPFRNADY